MNAMETCSVPNCERTDVKGAHRYCHMHYERWRRNADPLVDGRALFAERQKAKTRAVGELEEKQCKRCKETKPLSEYYQRGDWYYLHCKACHQSINQANRLEQRLKNPPPVKEKVDHGQCAFDGCDRKAVVTLKDGPDGWYCTSHWAQWRNSGELRPVKKAKRALVTDKFRQCTACGKVKTHDQFHKRSGGTALQSQCKTCYGLRTRMNFLIKEGRFDEAQRKVDEMPESMRVSAQERLDAVVAG